jgi:branched-chain amino acid transport system ATP-binding protein
MSVSTETAALQLESITAGYGRTTVLRDVTVEVPSRSIVAVLGPNGAGKTTLLRVAAGLLTPESGTVTLGGEDVTGHPAYHRATGGLCLMPEGRGIFRSLTVAENLLMFTPPWMHEQRLDKAFDAFPVLKERVRSTAGTLSGGQQQMLALARIYVSEPRVVLFDEVSMGLAPLVVAEIFEAITQLSKDGMSIVLVEQYVNRALEMADHAYMISRGRVTFSGSPSELDERTVLSGYLGTDLGAG